MSLYQHCELNMSGYKLDYHSHHKKSARGFQLPEHLLLGGGPSNMSDRVRRALATQCLNPLSEDTFKIMDDIRKMLEYVFQTKNPLTLAMQASGNGGNEAIITNLLDSNDRIIVAVGGVWGEKIVDIAERHGMDPLPLRKEPGEIYTVEELEAAIIKHRPALLFVTHGESTGGIVQKLEGLGELCHKYDCLLAVDAVVSIAVEPLFVDRWQIDAVNAGSQEAIGAPPGMCMLSFSPRAEERMFEKRERPPYYLDIKRLANYWSCFDKPREYHYTFSSNLLASLREALAQICEEGLDRSWYRHRTVAELFWKRLADIGLELVVTKPENRFHGVSCVVIPEDIDWPTLLDYIKTKHAIDITPGDGPVTVNKVLRVGFMGLNCQPEVVEYLIAAMEDGLKYCRSGQHHQNDVK